MNDFELSVSDLYFLRGEGLFNSLSTCCHRNVTSCWYIYTFLAHCVCGIQFDINLCLRFGWMLAVTIVALVLELLRHLPYVVLYIV